MGQTGYNESDKWTTAEIVYCSIAGVLMLMAFAEIFSSTGALSYSFVKVHLKAKAAKQRGVQYLSLIIMIIYWLLRIFFLGAMFSLIPVPHWQGMSSEPSEDHKFIPALVITISQYTSFGLVGLLLVMPTVISVNQIMTSPRDVKEKLEAVRATSTFPRVLIVMPVYNELPEVLHVAICSAIDGDYPKEHLHIFISFDNDAISDLYRALIRNLGIPADGEYYPPVLDLYFRGVQITVSRFPHGGKRLTQKKTFGLINSIYKEYPDKTDHLFVLFIDSDIVLPASTIANFVWDMELKPNSKRLLAMTGVITVTTKEDITFLNLLQDIEYVHGQFIGRAIESAVGGCVTLPGALTIFRYSAFLESYDEYFAERKVSDLWDFGRSHLGEDRYLTHLLMTKATQPKLIQFCHRATCKTEPVREWRNLMKQRRRWYLGFLTNEGAFLSDPHLWWKYPWLLAFRLVQDIVTGTSMVTYVTIFAIITGMAHWSIIWLGLLVAYFFLNWALMFTYGVWLGRYKALFYPMMFFIGPFVSWFLLVSGVITANERTWGGPRADAASKKDKEGGDVEKGENDNNDDQDQDRDQDQDGFENEEIIDDSEDEQIELPDHLFYPQQQVPRRRRRRGRRVPGPGKKRVDRDIYRSEGTIETVVVDEKSGAEKTSFYGLEAAGGDELNDYYTDTGDEAGDENSDVDVLDISEVPVEDSADYFGSRQIAAGFASSPFMTPDTQWWDDDKHLSSLGIVPFIHQPKIPEMFASAETLILTPIIPATPTSRRSIHSSTVSLSEYNLSGRGTPGPSKLRSTPGTPKMRPVANVAATRSVPSSPKMRPLSRAAPTRSTPGTRSVPSSPKIRPLSRAAPTQSTPGTPKMRPSSRASATRSIPGTPSGTPKIRPVSGGSAKSTQGTLKNVSICEGDHPPFRESKSRPTTPTPSTRQSASAPGSPKRRPQSVSAGKRSSRYSDRRRSIHSSADIAHTLDSMPTIEITDVLPRHSFCYVPVEFLTPNASAPGTPKMSPMIVPSGNVSRPPSDSCSSTPPIPSPALNHATLPFTNGQGSSTSKAPDAILNAALAIINTGKEPSYAVNATQTPTAIKRMSSRSRVFQLSANVPPVPAIPELLQNSAGTNSPSRSIACSTPPLDSIAPDTTSTTTAAK